MRCIPLVQAMAAWKAAGEPVLRGLAALVAPAVSAALAALLGLAVSLSHNRHAHRGPKEQTVQAPVVTLQRCDAARSS